MKLWRSDAFRIGLFTVFTHINPEVFSLLRHPERHPQPAQNGCDQKSAKGSQPVGHQNGLKLSMEKIRKRSGKNNN